ncbi:cytidylyltransferase domain-containing protein [Candidatus Pelagibacter communis]|uniref:cytidylyltransferase domain-containing protein n=1 Tax=Pelagibacter ubique TaxID=198252 RepID=UPI00094DC3C9|nr:NTP transferase domain-containing protein [Candidatus Pelagibacter ubique]
MLIIIQARTNSQRFPKKVLYKLENKPIIVHVLDRLKKSKFKNNLIVATSDKSSDDRLVRLLKKKKIKIYRGNLKNVSERLYETALKLKEKYFVRVSGDSPVIDVKILDKLIEIFKKKKYRNYDIITNVFPKTFPKGMSFEIIKREIISKNMKFMTENEKEHVTKYFYKNSAKFKIKNLENFNKKKYNLDLTLDKKIDLKRIKIYLNNNV